MISTLNAYPNTSIFEVSYLFQKLFDHGDRGKPLRGSADLLGIKINGNCAVHGYFDAHIIEIFQQVLYWDVVRDPFPDHLVCISRATAPF